MARSYRRIFLVCTLFAGACSSPNNPSSNNGNGDGGGNGPSTASGSSGVGANSSGGSATGLGGTSSGSALGGNGGSSGTGSGASTSGANAGNGSGGGGAASSGVDGGGPGDGLDAAASSDSVATVVLGDAAGSMLGTDAALAPYPGAIGDGDYMVGPTYTKSPDLMAKGMPAGKTFQFTMNSTSSMIFTGMATTLLAANQHSFTRSVTVYVPAKYKDGTAAPFMVIQDGPGQLSNVQVALDNLTQSTDPTRQLPTFVAIAVQNGGGDGVGSERGLEYDTVSDRYAQFVETEVLPAVLSNAALKAAFPNFALTTDPEGRGTVGCSSGSAAALTMGWFHPEWFHRIVTYSGTFVDQQNPAQTADQALYPLGAWDYHSDLALIVNTAPKPLHVFVNANEMDNGYDTPESMHHNWLMANLRTAAELQAQGYHYRFVEGLGAGHCDQRVQDLTMADTLLWVWQGYPLN
jgi:enterochelin esterase-like enzyme